MNKQELINNLAGVLHYECWYKENIEGKFGLEADGADHGRFRPSKNMELDCDFIKDFSFKEDGFSFWETEQGFPYYKMENNMFFVDSALLSENFNHLPPSWKEENIKAAELLVRHIEHCFNSQIDINRFIEVISEDIHNKWVARQNVNLFDNPDRELAEGAAFLTGTLNSHDINVINGKESVGEHSELFKQYMRNIAKEDLEKANKEYEINKVEPKLLNFEELEKLAAEKLKNIWGFENFVSFKNLPFEEQIKDTNQILYALKYFKDNNIGNKKWIEEQYNKVVEKVEEIKKNKSYKQEKSIED